MRTRPYEVLGTHTFSVEKCAPKDATEGTEFEYMVVLDGPDAGVHYFRPIAPWKEWLFILFVGSAMGLLGWMLGSLMLANR